MKSHIVPRVPAGTFKGRNWFTLGIVEYRKLHNREIYVEISVANSGSKDLGEFDFNYGVTFSGNYNHLSQPVDTYKEAIKLIESI
jgi:hypothetical protein